MDRGLKTRRSTAPSVTPELSTPSRPMSTPPVAAIVPAFNEAQGIGNVLDVLRQVELLTEIIVVDDGSTDGTGEAVRLFSELDPRLRLLRHAANQGKGQAVFTGWRATRAPYLLTLDADLIGLTPGQVEDLLLPVIQKRADMTLGLFQGGRFQTDNSHRVTPWLTGQRCFRAELMKHVSQPAASGYGFETALTLAARQRGLRRLRVPLVGVSHPPSETHRGLWIGIRTRSRMYAQILRAWYLAASWRRMIARLKQWTQWSG